MPKRMDSRNNATSWYTPATYSSTAARSTFIEERKIRAHQSFRERECSLGVWHGADPGDRRGVRVSDMGSRGDSYI